MTAGRLTGDDPDAVRPAAEPMTRPGRALAFALDAFVVWAAAAVLYRFTPVVLPEDPEMASLHFHVARALISVAYHAVMLRWLSGTMGHAVMKGAVVVAATGNKPGTARCVLRALLGVLDVLVVPLLVNVVMTVVGRDRRHLYDLCTGTRVVRYREPRPGPS